MSKINTNLSSNVLDDINEKTCELNETIDRSESVINVKIKKTKQ